MTWYQVEVGACKLVGFIHLMLAVAILSGGDQRFPPSEYAPLLQLTDGRAWPYGAAWLVGGVLMTWGGGRARWLGLAIGILVTYLFAMLFGLGAANSPNASYTPAAAYGGYGLINSTLLAMMVMHHHRLLERWGLVDRWGRNPGED